MKNNAIKTNHLTKSKLPVKARTLNMYELEAPIPPATYRFLLRGIVTDLRGLVYLLYRLRITAKLFGAVYNDHCQC